MIRPLAVVPVLLAATALPALAQEVNLIEGIYTGHGEGNLKVDLTHLQGDRYKVAISTMVPMKGRTPGCGGAIDGEVRLTDKGGVFQTENEAYDPQATDPIASERYCRISLRLDGHYGMVMTEGKGCLSYHGASCGFNGKLEHDAAGI